MHFGQQLRAARTGEVHDLVVAEVHRHHVVAAGAAVLGHLRVTVAEAGAAAPESAEARLREHVRHEVELLVVNAPEIAVLGREDRGDLRELLRCVGQARVGDDRACQLFDLAIGIDGQVQSLL